jgi:hypothetical protein
MALLKCDFEFKTIYASIDSLGLNRTLLWILHVDKIPPHIGISTFGSYFSLKANGKDEALPVEKLILLIRSKKIPTVIVELSEDIPLDTISVKFNQFAKAEDLNATCLTPIKELLAPKHSVSRLKDLLETLQLTNEIQKVYGLNLASTFKGIPFYTTDEIRKRLEILRNAKG